MSEVLAIIKKISTRYKQHDICIVIHDHDLSLANVINMVTGDQAMVTRNEQIVDKL